MPFRPNISTAKVSPGERLSLIALAIGFRECLAGEMLADAIVKERDRALAVIRRAESTMEERERANGALDVLEFMLEAGLRIDELVQKDLEAKR